MLHTIFQNQILYKLYISHKEDKIPSYFKQNSEKLEKEKKMVYF